MCQVSIISNIPGSQNHSRVCFAVEKAIRQCMQLVSAPWGSRIVANNVCSSRFITTTPANNLPNTRMPSPPPSPCRSSFAIQRPGDRAMLRFVTGDSEIAQELCTQASTWLQADRLARRVAPTSVSGGTSSSAAPPGASGLRRGPARACRK